MDISHIGLISTNRNFWCSTRDSPFISYAIILIPLFQSVTHPWKCLQKDSFIKKSSKSWKDNFRYISGFERKSVSECMVWPADNQAETNHFMQYESEPSLDKQKGLGRFDTELLLGPISSCNQHHSCCPHCHCQRWTIPPAEHHSIPSPHSQQVSGTVSPLWAALAFHNLVTYTLILHRYINLQATTMLISEGQLIALITKENTARLSGYPCQACSSSTQPFKNRRNGKPVNLL